MWTHFKLPFRKQLGLLFLLFLVPVWAHAVPTLTIGPFGPGTLDGTEPFNTFGACADTSAQTLAGEDCGESNGVARTQDVVSHIWSVTADNYTPGQENPHRCCAGADYHPFGKWRGCF